MIEETAIVTRVGNGHIWIKSQQDGTCGGCLKLAACGTATLARLLPKREFAIDCDLVLQVGDRVRVAIDDSHLLLSSLLLYLLPLLLMFLGVGMANQLLPPTLADVWLPELALALLLLAFWTIHRFQALLLIHLCCKPEVIGKMPPH